MFLRAKLMAIVGVGLAVMLLGFWIYYKSSQKRLEQQAAELARKEVEIAEQKAVREQMEKDIKRATELRGEVNRTMQRTQQSIDDMRTRMAPRTNPVTGQTTSLGKAAVEKTDTIERAVNRGTLDQLRCFELLTGSPLSEGERNGKITNSLCPDLLAQPKPVAVK